MILLCSAISFVPNSFKTVKAATGIFIEDFSTTTYYDVVNTNATGWGTGLVKSPDKVNPELTGSYNNSDDPVDVFVEGDYAYVADYHGDLSILDISDPTNPTSVSNYTGLVSATPTGVFVKDSVCYVTTRQWGLQIVDVSNPASPSNLSAYHTIDHARDVFVVGDYAYVADESGGVQIVNVNDPANPTNSSAIDIDGLISGVYVEDSKLYIVDYYGGFFVYDVSVPSVPVYRGNFSLASGYDLSVDGNTAYVACGWNGFFTINVTDSTTPTILDTYSTGNHMKDAKFEDHKVYVTDTILGVLVFDVTDPSDISLIGSYDTWSWPDGLFVKDKMVYVADYMGGFLVLDHTGFVDRVIAQSTAVVTVTDDAQIVKASMVLEDYSTLWSGMAIALYLSADGGANWQYLDNGEEITFTNPGTDLRFQLILVCFNLVNATWVSELNIGYTTELDSVGKNSPINNFDTNENAPTLTWYALTGAVNYLLQVDSTGSWISPELNVTVSGSASDYTTSPFSDGTYYWRIAGIDSDGDLGKWSTVWQFTVDTIDPIVTGPADFDLTEGETGYNITWILTEINIDGWSVYYNTSVDPGLVTLVGDELNISTDGLATGTYNFTCVVTDRAGNIGKDTVIVTVNAVIAEFNPGIVVLPILMVVGICSIFILKRRK